MTLSQLSSLTDDELCIALHIVNVIDPVKPPLEITRSGLTWFKHDMLAEKLVKAFPHLKEEAIPIYSSLLTKLGIDHKIEKKEENETVH